MAAAYNVSTRAIVILASSEAPSGVAYVYDDSAPVTADDAAYRRRRLQQQQEQQPSASATPSPLLPSTVTVSVLIERRTSGGGVSAAALAAAVAAAGSAWLRAFVAAHPETFGGDAAAANASYVGAPSLVSTGSSADAAAPRDTLPLAGVIGVAVAGAVLIALCCIGAALLLRRHHAKPRQRPKTPGGARDAGAGAGSWPGQSRMARLASAPLIPSAATLLAPP